MQLRQTGFSYDTYTDTLDDATNEISQIPNSKFRTPKKFTRNYHRVDIELPGCNPNANIIPEGKSVAYYNYLTTGTPQGGVSDVHYYEKVIYQNIYPNIDLEFFTDTKKADRGGTGVEYNFVVHPGGNPADIKLAYKGANKITLASDKLIVNVAAGDFTENIPTSYLRDNPSANIKVSYAALGNNVFTFSLPAGICVLNTDLIIDPTPNLKWGTYYGAAVQADQGNGIALDASHNVYIVGCTTGASGIATTGAYHTTLGGVQNAFVAKFNATGSSLLWGTYYGGTSAEYGYGIALDASNNVYITGSASSTSGIATTGAYQTTLGAGQSGFVAKFNSTGTSLLWGTYCGGAGGGEGDGIALDASDNVYITGYTLSATGVATTGAYQTTYGGGWDAFVDKFNTTGTSLLWGTYYGGTGTEKGNGIALDASDNVYITGTTESSSAIATTGAYQTTLGNGQNVFVAKFNSTGASLLWGTYYGGTVSPYDASYGIALDASDNVYITGFTQSASGIATTGAYQTTLHGLQNAFVAKFNSTGTSLLWGTYYGAGSDNGYDIVLDAGDNVYITGSTQSTSGIATTGGYQTTLGGGWDAFVAKFNASGASLLWGTYYGGTGTDYGYGITLDASDNVYITGTSESSSGIATTGAYQTTYGGGWNAYVAKFDSTGVLGIEPVEYKGAQLKLFPNPANNILTITSTINITNIIITNLIGQTVYTHEYNTEQVQIDISALIPGIYFVKVNGMEVRKFVKE